MTSIKLVLVTLLLAFAANSQKIAKKNDALISIEVENGTLMGSFLVPKSKTPQAVVLIIPGSGPTDRNCNSPALGLISNSFLFLTEKLYSSGIATLRVDKRVSGESAITFGESLKNVMFNDFIADAEKWIDTLQKDPRFSEIIVAGHSQGSLVGMIAAKNKSADKFISISGAGRPIDEILHDQFLVSYPNMSDSLVLFFDAMKHNDYMMDAPRVLKQTFPPMISKFMGEWMDYNPIEILQGLDIPKLIINGENDVQVPSSEAILLHGENQKSDLVLIPKMSHILKDAPEDRSANLATYNMPELPINEELVSVIVSFVRNK